MDIAQLWANLIEAHVVPHWGMLLGFYGLLLAAGVFAVLMTRLIQKAARGQEALDRMLAMEQEMSELRELKGQIRQLRNDTGALQAQLDKGYENLRERVAKQKAAFREDLKRTEQQLMESLDETTRTLQQRWEDAERTASRRLDRLEDASEEASRKMQSSEERITQVEKRIPDIYEHLEEFRNTLSRIFQSELSAVLDSFDSSVTAVLDHMKGELETGIKRIEGIESMVNSRQRAERTLLGRTQIEEDWAKDDSESETAGLPEGQAGDAGFGDDSDVAASAMDESDVEAEEDGSRVASPASALKPDQEPDPDATPDDEDLSAAA